MEKPKNFTKELDPAFEKIPFYQRYPQFRPFVGNQYAGSPVKILILGESHYLPEGSTIHKVADKWYGGDYKGLNDEEKKWTRTRGVVNSGSGQKWTKKGHLIFRNLELALIDAGLPKCDNMFSHVAYMNSFQRPAICKESISVKQRDIDVAVEVINGVVEIIKPNLILFVSRKAGKHLAKKINLEPGVKASVFPHPASAWWLRESKHGVGKDLFVARVKEAMLSNPTSPT